MSWNDTVIEQFRTNGGEVERFGRHLLLLHTTGAKSGLTRVTPMMYFAEPEGLFVIASKAGTPENPAWYHNLVAHPEVHVEQATDAGIREFDATAQPVERGLRDTLFARFSARNPGFAGYQEKTDRIIPVVQLHPVERTAP
ncbi:MAG: nitroreductase family deazaflavin-dependent oxidoreductase [Actinobacteria bacterium]|nr:nitroreductase family deazaflavin-dependent oxidoreductase [Actinomycetota bacterium]